MSLYKRYETDKGLEEKGAWVDFGDGVHLRIRRYKSKPVQDAKKKAERPYRNILDRGEQVPEDVAKKMLIEQVREAILVDWKGVTDRDGNPLEFTKDNVTMIMTDLPDLLSEVLAESTDRDRFKAEATEEAAKN